ncbi:MAG TPA: hypothetical protein VII47_01570, partial [Actinomycetota bacterium]
MAVSLLVACGTPAVVWAVGRGLAARRLESGLSRMGTIEALGATGAPAGQAAPVPVQALLDRLGTWILSTRAGAPLGRRIAATYPSVPPGLGAAAAVLAALGGALIPVLLGHPGAAPAGPPATLALGAALLRCQAARRREAIERQLPD